MNGEIPRHRTALTRIALSRPLTCALNDGLLNTDDSVFDYGCGRGDDLLHLSTLGITNAGWDPTHRPQTPLAPADLVNLGYVINVIEDINERRNALRAAWALSTNVLIVSARLVWDARGLRGRPHADGILTSTGTFQKFYTQDELRTWIEDTLDAPTLPAAPGVIYVFRDPTIPHKLLADRVRRRTTPPEPWVSEQLYHQYHDLLTPLLHFLSERGRLPRGTELTNADTIRRRFGSLSRAFAIIASVTGTQQWDELREKRTGDLLVYLALARFDGRPRFNNLPAVLQHDIREFLATYQQARLRADRLLLAAGKPNTVALAISASPVGKRTPTALYLHTSARPHLPPVLRVLDGCAQTLTGTIPGANVIKLHRDQPLVSYLTYPDFGTDPHPTLTTAHTVNLRDRTLEHRDYSHSPNPPLLHRTEEFLHPQHPDHERLSHITRIEVSAGLYEHPERIGTVQGWREICKQQKHQ